MNATNNCSVVMNNRCACANDFYFYFFLQNSPYIGITITQQNLHTLNKCYTHNGWNDHTEMKSPITGFQYKT